MDGEQFNKVYGGIGAFALASAVVSLTIAGFLQLYSSIAGADWNILSLSFILIEGILVIIGLTAYLSYQPEGYQSRTSGDNQDD
jgi:hypothetical protein